MPFTIGTLDGDRPLVSVIIPHLQRGGIPQASGRDRSRSDLSVIECIVFDDGSTDETPAIIESSRTRVRSERQPNQGFARARNRGAGLARSELVSFLDRDVWW
jgi:glycosyltransferase involved in cell wall biosynthesis